MRGDLPKDEPRAAWRDWARLRATAYVLGATAIFTLIFTSGRIVGDLASPIQIMFLRYCGGLVTVLIIALVRGKRWRSLQSDHRAEQALRALAGGLGGSALVFGNAHMPVADANAINLLSGVFMLAIGLVVFREKLTRQRLVGAVICICGAAVVMGARGAFSSFDPSYLVPASVVVVGALLLAIEGIFIKLLAVSDRPLVTLLHSNCFGAALMLVPALLMWQSWGAINLILLLLGPLAVLGQLLNIRGFGMAGVTLLAPLGYASLVFAAAWGWLLFGQVPTIGVLLGSLLIAAGGIAIVISRR